MGDKAEGSGLAQEWVAQFIAFAFLPGDENLLPSVLGQAHASSLLDHEVSSTQLSPVHKGERQAVGQHGPKLFHQIKGEPGAAGTVGMQEAHLRIETVRLKSRAAIVPEHGVQERQKRVDAVEWRPAGAPAETKTFFLYSYQVIKNAKIGRSGFALQPAQAVHGADDKRAAGDVGKAAFGGGQGVLGRLSRGVTVVAQGALEDGALIRRVNAALAATMPRTMGVLRVTSSAIRYWARRSRTLPLRGPSTRARNRPLGSR